MPDMTQSLTIAAEVAQARADAITEAATGAMLPRHTMTGFYNMGENSNTDDDCLIYPARVTWGAGLGEAVEVHYPADAPREEVCAVLRHIAAVLETNQLPQRTTNDTDNDDADETATREE